MFSVLNFYNFFFSASRSSSSLLFSFCYDALLFIQKLMPISHIDSTLCSVRINAYLWTIYTHTAETHAVQIYVCIDTLAQVQGNLSKKEPVILQSLLYLITFFLLCGNL